MKVLDFVKFKKKKDMIASCVEAQKIFREYTVGEAVKFESLEDLNDYVNREEDE